MNLDELRDVRRTERQRDGLQHLRESFYRDVASYLADLKAERERAAERADDPFSDPEVRRLTDEIESAEEIVESIYERRVGKVVKRASFAAAGMTHDDEGLTDEERDLFDDLVARIEDNRERVLDSLDPDAGTPSTPDADEGSPATDPTTDPTTDPVADPSGASPDPNDLLSEAMGGGADDAGSTADAAEPDAGGTPTADGGSAAAPSPGEASPPDSGSSAVETPAAPAPTPGGGSAREAVGTASESDGEGTAAPSTAAGTASDVDASGPDADRTTVYVTRDVGEIYGVDGRTYRLAAEDVVELPADNASALLERDAAEPLG